MNVRRKWQPWEFMGWGWLLLFVLGSSATSVIFALMFRAMYAAGAEP